METGQNPKGALWRKSSYSGSSGGDCIECAPLNGTAWRKSSYSSSNGGDCVEIAGLPHRVAVRDSKRPDGPALTLATAAFTAFATAAGRGEFGPA